MFRKRGGVDTGLFLGSEGVEFTAHTVDTVQYVIGTAMLGALEERMLNEVRHALVGSRLVAAAHVDVHTAIGNPRRRATQYDFQAIGQSVVFVHNIDKYNILCYNLKNIKLLCSQESFYTFTPVESGLESGCLKAMNHVQKRMPVRVPRVFSVMHDTRTTTVQATSNAP